MRAENSPADESESSSESLREEKDTHPLHREQETTLSDISFKHQEKQIEIKKLELAIREEERILEQKIKEGHLRLEISRKREQRLAIRQHVGTALTAISFVAGVYMTFVGNDVGYYLLGSSGTVGITKMVEKKSDTDNEKGD